MSPSMQIDWVEQQAAAGALNAIYIQVAEESLARYPASRAGQAAEIRAILVDYHAALLGQPHAGATIPADVEFRDAGTRPELASAGQAHAWAISASAREMAGGFGATQEQARARAMLGLMLQIGDRTGGRAH